MQDSVSPYQPNRYIKDIMGGQLVSITGGLLAGLILAVRLKHLYLLPGFFILFPGFLELQGDINTTIAARVGSFLHTNDIKKADHFHDREIKNNLWASFLLVIVTSLYLGIFSFFLSFLILHKLVFRLIFVSFLAGLGVNLILIPLTLVTSVWLYKERHDPDNIMGPFLTSLSDIFSVIVLTLIIGTLAS